MLLCALVLPYGPVLLIRSPKGRPCHLILLPICHALLIPSVAAPVHGRGGSRRSRLLTGSASQCGGGAIPGLAIHLVSHVPRESIVGTVLNLLTKLLSSAAEDSGSESGPLFL